MGDEGGEVSPDQAESAPQPEEQNPPANENAEIQEQPAETSEETKPEEPPPNEPLKPEETVAEAPESKPEEPKIEESTTKEPTPAEPEPEALKEQKSSVAESEVDKKPPVAETKSSKRSLQDKKESRVSIAEMESETVKASRSHESLGARKTHSSLRVIDSKLAQKRSSRLGSRAQRVLGSTISIRRLSAIGEFYDKSKVARFMNTFKLDSDNPFNPDKVQKILEAVMVEALENLTYDPEKCPKQAKWASSAIRAKVKELQFDRYKLICLVTIGEKNLQDMLVTCRFLWDVERDRYATYTIENTYVFGIAMCFGLYYE